VLYLARSVLGLIFCVEFGFLRGCRPVFSKSTAQGQSFSC
jgi:hypothetical protein